MGKGGSPLLGYNTNVRHKGKLYHIQTEDSGVHHPHIITHLFADGGRILASKKTSYAEHVDAEDLKATVKKLMQDQHKAMFIALRDGVYDEDETGEAADSGERPAPGPAEQPAAPAAAAPAAEPETPAAEPEAPAPAGAEAPSFDAFEAAAERLEKESAAAAPSPELEQAAESTPTERTAKHSGPLPAGPGRYQSTRPSQEVVDTSSRSAESIFGEDLLTEKSLDEVILSYLAEDLEDTQE